MEFSEIKESIFRIKTEMINSDSMSSFILQKFNYYFKHNFDKINLNNYSDSWAITAYNYYLHKAFHKELDKFVVKDEIKPLVNTTNTNNSNNTIINHKVNPNQIIISNSLEMQNHNKSIFPFFKYANTNSIIQSTDLVIVESDIEINNANDIRFTHKNSLSPKKQITTSLKQVKTSINFTFHKDSIEKNTGINKNSISFLNEDNTIKYFNIITIKNNNYLLIVKSTLENIFLTKDRTIKNFLIPYEKRLRIVIKLKSVLKKNFIVYETKNHQLSVNKNNLYTF